MADQDIQEAVREGRGLAKLYRSEQLFPAYTEAREVAGNWGFIEDGRKQSGLALYDPLDLVRLMAFCGHEEARGIVEPPECHKCSAALSKSTGGEWEACHDLAPLADWLTHLQPLAAKLPPKRVEAACPGTCRRVCCPHGQSEYVHPCADCGDENGSGSTGSLTRDTPAERWLLVVAAEACGRAMYQLHAENCGPDCECDGWRAISRWLVALDACRAWIEEPTPEREEAWSEAWGTATDDLANPGWLAFGPEDATASIEEAADMIPNAREIAAAAVLGRLA